MANTYDEATKVELKASYAKVQARLAWLASTVVSLEAQHQAFVAEIATQNAKLVSLKKDFADIDKVAEVAEL